MLTIDQVLTKAEARIRRVLRDNQRRLQTDALADGADPDELDALLEHNRAHNEGVITATLARLRFELPRCLRDGR